MAEQKRVTRRGTRAMMRPKPRRVLRCDPFKPQMMVHDEVWGTRGDDDRLAPHPDAFADGVAYEQAYRFARTYGGGADTLRSYFTQAQLYMIDDCEVV